MDDSMIETHLKTLDLRLARVEQILPTLATKEDFKPLATKDELRREIREEGDRSRRHMDIIAEALRSDIQLLAEHAASEKSKPRKG